MEFIVWVETRLDGRTLAIREVAKLERAAYPAGPEELGLTLKDGKTVLEQVQESIVQMQIQVLPVTERPCMHTAIRTKEPGIHGRPGFVRCSARSMSSAADTSSARVAVVPRGLCGRSHGLPSAGLRPSSAFSSQSGGACSRTGEQPSCCGSFSR